jgi:hypothetical protein
METPEVIAATNAFEATRNLAEAAERRGGIIQSAP